MILFFDTETTGLPQRHLPVDHPAQPRIVQLGAILMEGKRVVSMINLLVKPDRFEVPKQASDIHGFTTELAIAAGVPLLVALSTFRHIARNAEKIVGFNLQYDMGVMQGEFMRNDREGAFLEIAAQPNFCVMAAMTDICAIPSPYRAGQFKWPKLQEAHKHAFGVEFDAAHDAIADVIATADLYWWLMDSEPMTADEIHDDAQASEDAVTPIDQQQ